MRIDPNSRHPIIARAAGVPRRAALRSVAPTHVAWTGAAPTEEIAR
jgi:hypothetical protein